MRDSGYIVLVSCHKELRTHLHNNGIKYYVVLPNLENKDAFIQRYINRGNSEDFIRTIDENWESFCEELPWENAIRVGEDYISEALPTNDDVPVVHGWWVHDINNLYGCSECMKRETMSPKKLKPYCPNCGAKMDG